MDLLSQRTAFPVSFARPAERTDGRISIRPSMGKILRVTCAAGGALHADQHFEARPVVCRVIVLHCQINVHVHVTLSGFLRHRKWAALFRVAFSSAHARMMHIQWPTGTETLGVVRLCYAMLCTACTYLCMRVKLVDIYIYIYIYIYFIVICVDDLFADFNYFRGPLVAGGRGVFGFIDLV
ncbi:hypothetical protein BD289DRAFT_148048 [Coniella lustricola]|uniref:Uncharacterized protein n=1 Tax=Coniella lustricola TaxID=2025994 RepID=A0A2T2ZUW3_9PEZI|nr:hypothetical protein BD289DRAFT_148048 [Coniella lustricola]